MLLYQIIKSLYILYMKKHKKSYNNNKSEIPALTYSKIFGWPNGSYSTSDINDYFNYIVTKHKTVTENQPRNKYINKIENKITLKIKMGY